MEDTKKYEDGGFFINNEAINDIVGGANFLVDDDFLDGTFDDTFYINEEIYPFDRIVEEERLVSHSGLIDAPLHLGEASSKEISLRNDQKYSVLLQDGVTTEFFRDKIHERHPLVPLILEFNLRRAKDIHPSHYRGIGEVLFSRGFLSPIMNSRRSVQYLTRHQNVLIGKRAKKFTWFTDFGPIENRIALLPADILETVSIYLGMVIFHDTIKKVVLREGVHFLYEEFGKKATQFGIRRAPLFLHNISHVQNLFYFPEKWAVSDKVREGGRLLLGMCVTVLPKELQDEIIWKLPKGFLSQDSETPYSIGPEGFSGVQHMVLTGRFLPLLKKILLMEVGQEWTECFF
ncbi:MAG: SctK family type III secretion system sorting platform protein [Desulfovibrionaceae bacterium]